MKRTAVVYKKIHDRKVKGKNGIGSRTVRVKATHTTVRKRK